jgi:hypothetical protein
MYIPKSPFFQVSCGWETLSSLPPGIWISKIVPKKLEKKLLDFFQLSNTYSKQANSWRTHLLSYSTSYSVPLRTKIAILSLNHLSSG